MAGAIISVGVSLAVIIRSMSKPQNLSLLILMVLDCVNTAFYLIFGLRGLAEVYHQSCRALQRVRGNVVGACGTVNRKWTRQFLKSCGAIKMKFGGSNFVEMLTPLNCISHAVQLSVQILLLGK